jgi:hypothetical protein
MCAYTLTIAMKLCKTKFVVQNKLNLFLKIFLEKITTLQL